MKIKIHQFPFKFLLLTRKVCIFLFFIFHLGSLLAQNVGINVPNPAWPLDISAGQGVIRLQTSSSVYGSVLELKNNYASAEYLGAINFNDPFGFYPGQIGYLTNHNLTFRTSAFERMRIDANGNVGIGQLNPQFPIDVSAGQAVNRLVTTNNNNGSVLVLQNSTSGAPLLGSINFVEPDGSIEGRIAYFSNDDLIFRTDGFDRMFISGGRVGINRFPNTFTFEVEGAASKTSAGEWFSNSDARLKKNIKPLDRDEMLDQVLKLRGVSYEWNDDKTGSKRPEGIQYGFIAQDIQGVFPSLVVEDNLGYLQTAYGTYDPMMVEAIRALNEKIQFLLAEVERLNQQLLNSNSNHNEAAKD